MRSQRLAVLALALCLFTAAAYADSITSVSPQSMTQYSPEEQVTIDGTGLEGQVSTVVQFSSQAGTFNVTPASVTSTEVIADVPAASTSLPGTVTVNVIATDLAGTRVIGPGSFSVIAIGAQPPLLGIPEVVTQEASSASGANVSFTVTGFSFVDPAPTISCDHTSGALYPLGTTLVSCTATDSFGSTSGSFNVVVTDTVPPVLSLPAPITVITAGTSAVVTYTVTATDAIAGAVTPICSPASGATFPLGTTTVQCSATDNHANHVTGSFTVTVAQHTPPTLTLPADFYVEATGPTGATVTYSATANQSATVNCSPASGTLFGFGVTTVDCTAVNGTGESTTGSFNVTVGDKTPPVINVPADITVTASDANGATVTFVVTATDLVSGSVPVTCTPVSGSTFPIGTTSVQCFAFDELNNAATASFNVIVTQPPPTLTLPSNITAEATGPNGAAVTFTATAIDYLNNPVPVTCSPTSGSTFALGTTTVNCSATDTFHHTTSGSFTVTVQDTTPPTLSLPSNITAEATGPNGAVVTFTATASDLVDISDPVTCSPASGSTFALGTTTVQCSATDAHHNTAFGSFTVTVKDTTPPVISSITATPNVLWPPNHNMVDVTVSVVATDTVDPNPLVHIVSVSSDQPINGTGDGDTSPDWIITGPLTLQLRAERAGNVDRTYTITVQATDFSGNSSLATVQVRVTQVSHGHSAGH